MTPDAAQIAVVRGLLPSDAEAAYGWGDAKVIEKWTGSVAGTVRLFWLQRTNDTAAFIDLGNEGLPASQQHAHAKAMLEYWDAVTKLERPTSFGRIKSRRCRDGLSRI